MPTIQTITEFKIEKTTYGTNRVSYTLYTREVPVLHNLYSSSYDRPEFDWKSAYVSNDLSLVEKEYRRLYSKTVIKVEEVPLPKL